MWIQTTDGKTFVNLAHMATVYLAYVPDNDNLRRVMCREIGLHPGIHVLHEGTIESCVEFITSGMGIPMKQLTAQESAE
jgi:hypothetical protein